MTAVLEVRDLTVDFAQRRGPKVRAVNGVSLDLHAGQTLALVGESGSGKSTIIRVLARLITPGAGHLTLDGRPIARHGQQRHYRAAVQMVFQDPFASLNPAFSVAHHLARPLLVHHQASRRDVDAKVSDLLTSVNLVPPADMAAKYPHQPSGGQRQRVAIARALAPDPTVLLADEPVSMLDVSIRLEILNLLDQLKQDRDLAMLYVTHDLTTARHFSTQILVMYRGEIVEQGPTDDVILRPAHPYTQLLANAAPRPRGAPRSAIQLQPSTPSIGPRSEDNVARQQAPNGERHDLQIDTGCPFRARCPHAMDICTQHPPDIQTTPGHVARCWLHTNKTAGPA